MSDRFETLIKQVKNCTVCAAHLPCGPRPVLQIDPHAKILIAGQAPGKKVHKTGIPFDDPSGDRLRKWMGIDKSAFYSKHIAILPMGFCYPGTGKSGDLPPRPECVLHWHKKLLTQLVNVKLTLVIGQYAIAYHLSGVEHKNLTDTVKHWQDYWPTHLPLPHPSPRNNIWLKKNVWFEEDVLPVLRKKVSQLL